MSNIPILTQDEVHACIVAVDTLLHFDKEAYRHPEFDYPTRYALLSSGLKKLNVYSPFTSFTKQEFLMINQALAHIIELDDLFGDYRPELHSAYDKTAELAGL